MSPVLDVATVSATLANVSFGRLVTDAMFMCISGGSLGRVIGFKAGTVVVVLMTLLLLELDSITGSITLSWSSVNGHRWNSLLSTV